MHVDHTPPRNAALTTGTVRLDRRRQLRHSAVALAILASVASGRSTGRAHAQSAKATPATSASEEAMEAVVPTQYGKVGGRVADSVYVCKGVPSAAPPFGPNRLRPPQPVAPWNGVRDAITFGPKSPNRPIRRSSHCFCRSSSAPVV